MTSLALRTRNFWCAAYFLRRAPDRDRTIAVKALAQVATMTTGKVHDRAITILRETYGTDADTSRAS